MPFPLFNERLRRRGNRWLPGEPIGRYRKTVRRTQVI